MKVMFLAAGKGVRLKSMGLDIPKPMMRLGGKPLLEYMIEWLARCEVRDMVINLHHQPKVVRNYFGDGSRWEVRIRYSYEKRLLGTAGGVKAMESFFDETFLVWYGDNLCRLDVSGMAAFHRSKGGIATVALSSRPDPCKSGIVSIGNNGQIERFSEKPHRDRIFSNLVNAGIYVLEPEVFQYIPKGVFFDFGKDLFPTLIKKQEVFGYKLREPLFWIDTPEEYLSLNSAIESGKVNLG